MKPPRGRLRPAFLLALAGSWMLWAWPTALVADEAPAAADTAPPFVVVLGVAQDGGVPHAGCRRDCCRAAYEDAALRRQVSCLGLVDPQSQQRWMIDCTPDFPHQLQALRNLPADDTSIPNTGPLIDGILLTHAHIGHYSGLMHLGREVIGADGIAVYAMPRMTRFLTEHGPWSQLVALGNVRLQPLTAGAVQTLNPRIRVTPFLVPHRDEFSETVGFRIAGPQRSLIFIPDIDKWERWGQAIETLIASSDAAYLDGTFYANDEIPGRDISEIPHPFISESLERFATLPRRERSKIRFIHLNHSNPAWRNDSDARQAIQRAGMSVAVRGERFEL